MLPELGVILDAGTGIFRARDLIQTKHLDIFLSHVHLDHVIGLTFLFDILHEKNVERVTVHLESSKVDTIKNCLFNQQLFPAMPDFELRVFDDKSTKPISLSDGSTLTPFPVEHPGGCHGFRIDWPYRSMAYVTDTVAASDADYLKSINGVDTLVHECYFPDGWEERAELTGHSCLTPVGKVAAASGAKRLFLVHTNPLDESGELLELEKIKAIFPETVVPNDQDTIDV